jgi:hypothetical protein
VFNNITIGELPYVMPVLEVSPVAHVVVHSERGEQLHLTSRDVLENPTMDDASALLSDVVEHYRLSLRDLQESLKGPKEGAPHTSHIEHHEVHDGYIEVHSGLHATFELPVVVE